MRLTSGAGTTEAASAADDIAAADAVVMRSVTKRFGRSGPTVVSDVDLRVPSHTVFGLLGPNGAGKSTILRMLVDLVRPTSGEIEVLGADAGGELDRIGTMIESPALYPHLTGRQHLTLVADLAGVDRSRIDEVLDMVGFHEGADRSTGGYSTGMGQRLALAAALITDPELLILDEPSAGLDPEGVAEVRGLLRRLGEQGRTILLSSHLLGEVGQVCDHLGVLLDGELVYQGSIEDLVAGDPHIVLRADPTERAADVMAEVLGHRPDHDDGRLIAPGSDDVVPVVARRLVEAGVEIHELTTRSRSLEQAYLELTRRAG